MNSKLKVEKFLQNYRFGVAYKELDGDVLDFGGNWGEFGDYGCCMRGDWYFCINDIKEIEDYSFGTIVVLAVIEHIEIKEVYEIFKQFKKHLENDGKIVITTPTQKAHSILKILARFGLIDKENLKEHKHYWSKREIYNLAEQTGFRVIKYKTFQFGFNQFIIMGHR